MTEYARFAVWAPVTLTPGDERTFRLPTLNQGPFSVSVAWNPNPPSESYDPNDPPEGAATASTAALRIAPDLKTSTTVTNVGALSGDGVLRNPNNPGGGSPPPPPNPGFTLDLQLLHGEEVVTNVAFPMQSGPAPDDSWRIRLTASAAPLGVPAQTFLVTLTFVSMFPILTRTIPIAFFQQAFNEDWNTHSYISGDCINGAVSIRFDPELASYHHLSDISFDLHQGFDFENVAKIWVESSNLAVASVKLNIFTLKPPIKDTPSNAAVALTVAFSGTGGQPIYIQINGSVEGAAVNLASFNMNDFEVEIDLTVTNGNGLIEFVPSIDWDIAWNAVHNIGGATGDIVNLLQDVGVDALGPVHGLLATIVQKAEALLASYNGPVGSSITPWLLGAAYDVRDVRFDPVGSQAIPTGLPKGDLLVDYVGTAPVFPPPQILQTGAGASVPPKLAILSPDIVRVAVGQSYSCAFVASGGTPPYSWSLGSSLPQGASFASGVLSGAFSEPTLVGLTINAHDLSGATATQSFFLVAISSDFSIPGASLPDAVVGIDYVALLEVQGGQPPYAWTTNVSAAQLSAPAGLTLLASGALTGAPTGQGQASVVLVKATDAGGKSAFQALQLNVLDPKLVDDRFYVVRGDGEAAWRQPPPFAPTQAPTPQPKDAAAPATTPGALNNVDHIVVLMMENRSFDHMLGYLSKEGGRADIEGLKLEAEGQKTQFNCYKEQYYYPTHLTDTQAVSTEDMSPDHSHDGVRSQMTDGMMHFVSDYAKKKVGDNPDLLKLVMGYYGASELPFYDLLAREFVVCDHWFCSHVGPTWPNRFVTLSGDLNRDSYGEPEVDTPDASDFTPSEAPTLFDYLAERGVSWVYFQQNIGMLRVFTKYTFDMKNVREYGDANIGFLKTVVNGLPSVTFVDPLFGDLPAGVGSPQDNDDAPPSDLKDGQRFVEKVTQTLFDPKINLQWQRTMLIITYDEHGGFYDHVEPPDNFPPLLGQVGGKIGPRVPAFIVSAWTPQGQVLHDNFEHCSIAATILRRFCSPNPPFMSARVAAATDLRGALSLTAPRSVLNLDAGGYLASPPTPNLRTAARAFTAPRAPDAFGSLLGGIAMTIGRTPKN